MRNDLSKAIMDYGQAQARASAAYVKVLRVRPGEDLEALERELGRRGAELDQSFSSLWDRLTEYEDQVRQALERANRGAG